MNRLLILLIVINAVPFCSGQTRQYLWLAGSVPERSIITEIAPPAGYERTPVESGSFGDWLRHLPLKPAGSSVHLYDGTLKLDQSVHHAVVDMDIGSEDIQQCADAVLRLRAEYLYSVGNYDAIRFQFTSGDISSFTRWASGMRPVVKNGNEVTWRRSAGADSSYTNFRRYLKNLFYWAGSYSLSRELRAKTDVRQMRIGDVFIRGGFPGHVVIVTDMARHPQTGEIVFMLAQSYMPAQDIHVLKNPNEPGLSPWYALPRTGRLITPEYYFNVHDLKSFE